MEDDSGRREEAHISLFRFQQIKVVDAEGSLEKVTSDSGTSLTTAHLLSLRPLSHESCHRVGEDNSENDTRF